MVSMDGTIDVRMLSSCCVCLPLSNGKALELISNAYYCYWLALSNIPNVLKYDMTFWVASSVLL